MVLVGVVMAKVIGSHHYRLLTYWVLRAMGAPSCYSVGTPWNFYLCRVVRRLDSAVCFIIIHLCIRIVIL